MTLITQSKRQTFLYLQRLCYPVCVLMVNCSFALEKSLKMTAIYRRKNTKFGNRWQISEVLMKVTKSSLYSKTLNLLSRLAECWKKKFSILDEKSSSERLLKKRKIQNVLDFEIFMFFFVNHSSKFIIHNVWTRYPITVFEKTSAVFYVVARTVLTENVLLVSGCLVNNSVSRCQFLNIRIILS